MIVVVADESELEGAEEVVAAAIRDWTSEAGGIAVFRCHVPESRGGSVEVDALVCTPQGATVIEVKGFTARQDGTLATPPNGPWTVDGTEAALYHAVRVPNPFVQVRRQVFAAKNLLQQSGIFGWVNAVVVLVPQPGSRITLEESRIADGYRAVLIDRDDASALHDYFHAETGRTVRLSVNDVRRVFDALNLAHLLPSRVELADQGFPARLAPTTSSRPAPTAPEQEEKKDTSAVRADAGATSPLSIRASAPAFLAAIDRLAHRPRRSGEPDREQRIQDPEAGTGADDRSAVDAGASGSVNGAAAAEAAVDDRSRVAGSAGETHGVNTARQEPAKGHATSGADADGRSHGAESATGTVDAEPASAGPGGQGNAAGKVAPADTAPADDHRETTDGSQTAESGSRFLGTSAGQAAAATATGGAIVAAAGASAARKSAEETSTPQAEGSAEPASPETDTTRADVPPGREAAEATAGATKPVDGVPTPPAPVSTAGPVGEAGSNAAGPANPDATAAEGAGPAAVTADAAAGVVAAADAEGPHATRQKAEDEAREGSATGSSTVETPASHHDPGAGPSSTETPDSHHDPDGTGGAGTDGATAGETAGHGAVPSESVASRESTEPSVASSLGPRTAESEPDVVSLIKSPTAGRSGEPDLPAPSEIATTHDTAREDGREPDRDGEDASWQQPAEPSHRGRSSAATATAAGLGAAAGAASAAAWSAQSSSDPRPAQQYGTGEQYESGEQYDSSEHWSQWVEQDRRAPRQSLSSRVRERVGGRSSGPSLLDRWRNTPVRERRPRRRAWVRIGPGVGLILFIVLFGAGFFAITAVNASRFEMSDYDRMCGDRKPFPNAAEYQRDGARPIYLSGELATMVATSESSAWRPSDTSSVQLIACMQQVSLGDLVVTCQYPPAPGEPIGRTVNLFRATYEVTVYELRTGREVARATMAGERYSADPANTDPDRCRGAADAPDYLGRRLGQPSTAQVTGFLAPLVHADR
ncbi:hypothetical protein NN3_54560 [Nocardia neocaledoniensis NBRC 108232]|uniref:Nuclease-like protein n=1 Tax=Nocardia neocaledoniensis TaxID=236511 RepID=A0A317P1F6_9NOCA|nr:NERD domain-containing protein [Nocardia neocaledoniensis]PWV80955.1 nuclease-like protein [Nocardia neocaledoniensis]GEM34449.1 hypothetical protein NN3_54560 [Nocardia neocaledoniensis NBRC 108232]